MAKQSERARVLAEIDATIGELRAEIAEQDAHIGVLMALKERLTGASSEPTEAKPKRTRKKRGMPAATTEATA